VLRCARPAKATTLSVKIGGGEFYITFVPPSGAGPALSAVGFKADGSAEADGQAQAYGDSLPLLSDDKELSMRVFLDNVVAECYWQGGRVAMTVPIKPVASATISAAAGADVQLLNGTSWGMTEIMTTKEAVLAQLH
jgi:hypothetical protein